MTIFRTAHENDLRQVQNVYYQNEVRGVQSPPPPGALSPVLYHILSTGSLYVAEQDSQILAYAGTITRSATIFLTDLFVHPEVQSTGLGKTLLQHIMPPDELIHCTMTSTDPRAQALYIRAGMQPKYPNFNLQWDEPAISNLPTSSVEIVEGDPTDPAFIQWDAKISGRERPMDHTFWIKEEQAVPLWFKRNDVIIGYGYIRLNVGTLWHLHTCRVGPLGVYSTDDATDCVLAAIRWACKRADRVYIDVPGPHPCLATLLDCGFHITYVELFVSNEATSFFDAERYIPSGSNLL